LAGKVVDACLGPPKSSKTAKKKSAEWRRNGIFFFPLVQGFHKALFLNIFLSFILAERKAVDFQ